MNFKISCTKCRAFIWVRGNQAFDDPQACVSVIDGASEAWLEACEHMIDGEYEITDFEDIDV